MSGGPGRGVVWGGALLGAAWLASLVVSRTGIPVEACLLGADPLRPDRSVCELAFGGLWISLGLGLAAAALATSLGLAVAVLARIARGGVERVLMRGADAIFSLPDVLLLMVLQAAGQTLGEVHPQWRLPPGALLVVCLALVSWAGPARMFRERLATLEQQQFVAAATALGATRAHLFRAHLWRGLRGFALTVLVTRVPAAILAESTVSFLGIARMEGMSLGRYLGTSYTAILYEGGARVVLPAWSLLVLVVLGTSLMARGMGNAGRGRSPG